MGRWKAEEWVGKINAVRFVKAKLTLEEREMGLTVFEVYGDPLGFCAVCGTPLYHHWEFVRADGGVMKIGQECAAVVLGQSPASYLKDASERAAAEAAIAREEGLKAEQLRWWRADEQADLRAACVLGARAERKSTTRSDFYRRAWKAGKSGSISPKFREWVVRASVDGAAKVVARTARGLELLWALTMIRPSLYDAKFIQEMSDREFPIYDDRKVYGAPLSEKQVAALEKMAHRYRKQIETGKLALNR